MQNHLSLMCSQYCYETAIIQIKQRKVKNVFLDDNSKKNHFIIKSAYVGPIFGRKFNFRINI